MGDREGRHGDPICNRAVNSPLIGQLVGLYIADDASIGQEHTVCQEIAGLVGLSLVAEPELVSALKERP
jgi:hypothetical protein